MTDFISCSLCDQGWLADDPDLAARKRRHEEFHASHITNVVGGHVEWLITDDPADGDYDDGDYDGVMPEDEHPPDEW